LGQTFNGKTCFENNQRHRKITLNFSDHQKPNMKVELVFKPPTPVVGSNDKY